MKISKMFLIGSVFSMNFEQPTNKSESQTQLEKLQQLHQKEKLALFELAYRMGVTPKQETTTNFLSQLHSDHLTGLYEKWHELDMKVSEQGTDIASLSSEEVEILLQEVIGKQY